MLVEAGIKPLDVIKIATRNGGNALGILNKTGTIENGKEAGMIILEQILLTISVTQRRLRQ